VASGMADVGLGVETPARHFKLDFLPLATESYFFVCQEPSLGKPGIQAVLAILRSKEFQQAVNDLPGYVAHKCGHIETLQQAFPSFRPSKKRSGR
jgi:molybdate-binding protein